MVKEKCHAILCHIHKKCFGNPECRCNCIKYDHLKYNLTLKEVVYEGHLFCPQKFERIKLGVLCIYKIISKYFKMPTYKIVMVRHGESEWNKENKFCGW